MRFAGALRLAGAAASLASLLHALPAGAQTTVEPLATFTASIGVTDNVSGTPEPTEPGDPEPAADVFAAFGPGVALIFGRPRSTYRISYNFNANLHATHPEGNSLGNAVGLAARFDTTETTNLLLSLSAEQGQLNQVVVGQPAPVQPVQAVATGSNVFFRVTGGEAFEKQLSDVLTFVQAAGTSVYLPIDGQRVNTVDASLGLSRQWEFDTGGVNIGSTYTRTAEITDDAGVTLAGTQQLLNRATLSWIHQYPAFFSHQLDVGVLVAMNVDDPGRGLWSPVGLAAIRYTREEIIAALEYAHDAGPNVFLGTNVLSDSVTLRATVPLAASGFTVDGSGGYAMSRGISADGELGEPVDTWSADAGLSWVPYGATGNIQLSLRYGFVAQGGEDAPQPGQAAVQGFERNTVVLSLTGAFPDVAQATAPAAEAPPYRPRPEPGRVIEEATDTSVPGEPGTTTSPTGPRPPSPPGAAPP